MPGNGGIGVGGLGNGVAGWGDRGWRVGDRGCCYLGIGYKADNDERVRGLGIGLAGMGCSDRACDEKVGGLGIGVVGMGSGLIDEVLGLTPSIHGLGWVIVCIQSYCI